MLILYLPRLDANKHIVQFAAGRPTTCPELNPVFWWVDYLIYQTANQEIICKFLMNVNAPSILICYAADWGNHNCSSSAEYFIGFEQFFNGNRVLLCLFVFRSFP